MGTKVQHKMHLSGYYPLRDLIDSTGSSNWSSRHEKNTFRQYYGLFSAQQEIEGYDKEQLRQTILKHEMIFRQQLHELHRLYKIQADMMKEVSIKEPHKYCTPNGASQSRFFAFPSLEDKIGWHDSSLPSMDLSNHIVPAALGSDSNQSQLRSLQRRSFDLELPADECVIDGDEGQGTSGGAGLESCPPIRNCEKNGQLHLGFADLNEPFPGEETSGTASVDILGNITSSREHMQRHDLSVSSCSGNLVKETSQSPSKGNDGVGLSNVDFENGLPCKFNPGQSRDNRLSENEGLHCEYLPEICKSSIIGSQKAEEPDQNRREQSTKKTIFGVDISETKKDAPVAGKQTWPLQPLISSESSSISSWKTYSGRQNLTLFRGSPSINTFPKSDNRVGDSNSASGQPRQHSLQCSMRAEGGDSSSNRMILGVPIFENIPKDLSSESSMSKASVSEVVVNNGVNSVKPRLLVLADLNHDPISEQVSIDLNVSMAEDEPEPELELNHFSSTPKSKIVLDINLEAPVNPEADMDTLGVDFIERDESGDGSMRFAADALIAISSSVMEASLCDSLHWFAEIVSSYEVDYDAVSDSEDFFEYMTLNLSETKLEEYCYRAEVVEDAKDEEVALPIRPRRGQARRGRQRKDFQRDVLPGIVSLSRNDVTEDLQTIEVLVRATGGNWQSSLSNSNRGRGRGRKRSSAMAVSLSPSQPETEPQFQEQKCRKLGLEESRLSGWGKRTRRPPRQRCLINYPSLPLQ